MDILTLPSVLCLIVGTGLIILEMVLPGFGIPGISGIALVVIGIFVTGGTAAQMLTIAAVVLAVLIIALPFCLRAIAKGRFNKSRIVLKSVSVKKTATAASVTDLVGKSGITQTMLRPTGIALIDGEKYSVVTGGEFVEKDRSVLVTEVHGNKITVKEEHTQTEGGISR
ncbi:MAG: hypothetical protein GX246_05235 [Clostridiales bacterium]|nr:NfeD family protein [Bacillota bacterium]NLL54538.1 hypothetical protein [Clostridiales bacterium]